MDCRTLIEFLMDYLAGELPSRRRALFEEHLAECGACVRYLDSYRRTVALGKAAFADPDGAVPEEVPGELVDAVLSALGPALDGSRGRRSSP